jgi:hypothetical protein
MKYDRIWRFNMATDLPNTPSDVELLHNYLGQRLQRDGIDLPLDDALAGFEEYYRQLRDLRGKVREAEESLARGHGKPLDAEAMIRRVRKRLAEQGVAE